MVFNVIQVQILIIAKTSPTVSHIPALDVKVWKNLFSRVNKVTWGQKIPKKKIQRKWGRLSKGLTSLGMSEVDIVLAWGGQTSTPPISKYFCEFFSPSLIKLTYNKPNKDFK